MCIETHTKFAVNGKHTQNLDGMASEAATVVTTVDIPSLLTHQIFIMHLISSTARSVTIAYNAESRKTEAKPKQHEKNLANTDT